MGCTYILLTKREGRTGRISVRGLDNTPILPVRPRASLVNNRFITRLKMFKKMPRSRTEKHRKLQARNSDWEPTRRILTSDIKQN